MILPQRSAISAGCTLPQGGDPSKVLAGLLFFLPCHTRQQCSALDSSCSLCVRLIA